MSPSDIDLSRLEIREPADIRESAALLCRLAAEAGNLMVAPTDDIASPKPMVDHEGHILVQTIFGWGDTERAWWKDMPFLLNAPLLTACRRSNQIFWIGVTGAWTRSGERLVPELDFSDFEDFIGSKACIVAPVRLAFGRIGVAVYHSFEQPDLTEVIDRHGLELQLAASLFLESYHRIHWHAADRMPNCSLTRHEVTCLRWVAMGKTDEEIALITRRTRATVRFHLRSAATKLDAVNRAQSVFKAAQLGYISLVP